MKTEEDEAFDELAKRQGAWGGGFKAKQAMAMDKLQEPVDIASIIACREMLDAQPVPARVQYMGEDDDDDTQVYKKPWVGLTDEQRLMALKFIDPKTARLPQGFKQFAEAIEKLLKDQNT